jgi:hypothetical protein
LIRAENLREFLVQIRILIARKLGRHVFCIHTRNILISQILLTTTNKSGTNRNGLK